jgi:peptide/nickel transport system permease protein
MTSYIARRLVLMVVTLFGVSVIIFALLRLVPGNIADILFDSAGLINPAEKKEIEQELGLDRPIVVQYGQWIGGLLQGDLGYSYKSERPAIDEIAPRLPVTGKLAALALAFSILFGVPLGVVSAVRQDSALDYVLRVVSLSGLSMPAFWLGLLILMAFVSAIGVIPIYTEPPRTFAGELALLSVPAIAVGFRSSALLMRLTRSAMLEVLRQDYIRTARAKGLRDRVVVFKHALRNAFIPVITVIGIQVGNLIGGSVIIEQIFGLPGVGWLLYQGISGRDYPVVQVSALFLATVFVVVNLLVDLTYAYLDPRIKYT